MEEKINIAEILKDKPENTKLYSPLFGDVYFLYVDDDLIKVTHHGGRMAIFFDNGRYYDYPESEPSLFPSKEMRDWRKFSWKKGDVLVSEDRTAHLIFEKFTDDTYTTFIGKYHYANNDYYVSECDSAITDLYTLETEDSAQPYIKTIEEKWGGKLNLETLEIEKSQPEFKDGDIVTAVFTDGDEMICVFKEKIEQDYMGYCGFFSKGKHECDVFMDLGDDCICDDSPICKEIRLATEGERQQLFSALAKEGKCWDSEKKMIVDLKPKVEFKPFDKVLCRNSKDDTWEADFFARLTRKEIDYTQSDKYLCVGDLWMYCIPYNEETAHLLGTTDDWEGGEQ